MILKVMLYAKTENLGHLANASGTTPCS